MPADMAASPTRSPSRAVRRAVVTRNERVRGGCRRIVLALPPGFPPVRPGQFAMLSVDDPRFPLLPRPFCVLGWRPDGAGSEIEFLIMPVGRGSGILCDQAPGSTVSVVGPLGNALDDALPAGPVMCVAGGYGVAPFVFLLEAWRAAGQTARAQQSTVIFGARTAERLFLEQRLRDTEARVEIATDDGSDGFHGRVDALAASVLADARTGIVLTCGPEPMMEAVGRVARAAGVPCRASLETLMGCGYAVCNGCAVAVDDATSPDGFTYHLACREGTVFDETCLHWHQP